MSANDTATNARQIGMSNQPIPRPQNGRHLPAEIQLNILKYYLSFKAPITSKKFEVYKTMRLFPLLKSDPWIAEIAKEQFYKYNTFLLAVEGLWKAGPVNLLRYPPATVRHWIRSLEVDIKGPWWPDFSPGRFEVSFLRRLGELGFENLDTVVVRVSHDAVSEIVHKAKSNPIEVKTKELAVEVLSKWGHEDHRFRPSCWLCDLEKLARATIQRCD